MKEINLEKSLNLTRNIMNKKIPLPSCVEVFYMFGMMQSFHFKNSDVEIPIEHLGLSLLARDYSKLQVSVTVKDDLGKLSSVIEPLTKDLPQHHMANFLSFVNPNALNWFKDFEGRTFRFEYVGSNVMRPTLYSSIKDINLKTKEDYRINALKEGYKNALNDYQTDMMKDVKKEDKEVLSNELNELISEDKKVFETGLFELKTKSDSLLKEELIKEKMKEKITGFKSKNELFEDLPPVIAPGVNEIFKTPEEN